MVGRKLFFDDIPDETGIVVHYDRNKTLPFIVEHIVTISNVPEGEVRMKCASIASECVITALNGTAIVELDNVKEQRMFQLKRKSDGVFVPKMTWIRISSFSPGAIIMIMGDKNLARCRWIEDYGEFVKQKLARMHRKPKRVTPEAAAVLERAEGEDAGVTGENIRASETMPEAAEENTAASETMQAAGDEAVITGNDVTKTADKGIITGNDVIKAADEGSITIKDITEAFEPQNTGGETT